MSNKNKVAIIFTGGTISMKIDPRIHAAIPALTSEEIISMVTNIENFSEIEVINYANIPSPHITPSMMMEIADLVKQTITRDDITGVIVTHGTDTLEETAYLLDLIIKTEKPIVVVGAMRNSSELGYDGSSNLSAALCTAIYRDIISHQFIDTNIIEEKVGLIKSVPGMESDILDFYINSGYKGIVIESLGRGNLPPQMIPGIKKAISQNIPVVIVSRCPTGRVLDSYGYEGGGKHLRELGVIFGGNLPGQKIRIKLMLALGSTKDMHKIKEIIEQNLFN